MGVRRGPLPRAAVKVIGSDKPPVALDEDGTLWLRSSDYAAKTELLFAAGEIASRANAALGSSLVRRIRFRA